MNVLMLVAVCTDTTPSAERALPRCSRPEVCSRCCLPMTGPTKAGPWALGKPCKAWLVLLCQASLGCSVRRSACASCFAYSHSHIQHNPTPPTDDVSIQLPFYVAAYAPQVCITAPQCLQKLTHTRLHCLHFPQRLLCPQRCPFVCHLDSRSLLQVRAPNP